MNCGLQWYSASTLRRSLLCQPGTDSDCSGGAAAWECAAAFLRAAGVQAGLPVSLETRSVCATCICLVLQVTEGFFSVRWFAFL